MLTTIQTFAPADLQLVPASPDSKGPDASKPGGVHLEMA